MAGKKSTKVMEPEAVSAVAGIPAEDVPAAAEVSVGEAPAAAEVSVGEAPAAAEVSSEEAPAAAEVSAEEIPAVADPQEQAVAAEDLDIFSDEILLKEEAQNLPEEDPTADSERFPESKSQETVQEKKMYEITCRNNVSEVIGGVRFVGGVGHTRDVYAASWFRNKAGYSVDPDE